jgi:hypothetical protein
MVDLNPSHLSRVLRGADRAKPSIDLIGRVNDALALPPGYFPELREVEVIRRLRKDPELRDRLYDRLTRQRLAKTKNARRTNED